MPEIFETLPGLEVPVGRISRELARWWERGAEDGRPTLAADDAKATQVNFVLHLGFNTDPADATEQFETMLRFAQRYPARVVVLCPLQRDIAAPEIKAKIYGECFLGKAKSDKRCVEFVMLSYSRSARPFLENQVSICLSTDLPLYYWAHRFSASGRLADYQYLLGQARRVVLDSATAPPDAFTYRWPNPAAIRDLACCRLLPVRQNIGQFLSAYAPAQLVDGLRTVAVRHGAALAAEARVLLAWLRERLAACEAGAGLSYVVEPGGEGSERSLAVTFGFESQNRYFRWRGDAATGQGFFEVDLGTGSTELAAGMSLLPPESALGEAVFF